MLVGLRENRAGVEDRPKGETGMTSSKNYWWTRKSFETGLTVAVFVWLGALVVDVIRTAHTPVRSQLFASIVIAGTVAVFLYVAQKRKHKAPTKRRAGMPAWVPSMQTWYTGGILLLLVYLQVVTYGSAVGAAWASAWLSFSAPFSDLVARVVPPIDTYSESLATHGYQERVAIVRHTQAVSWVWLFLVNIYLVVLYMRRWSYVKEFVKTQKISYIILLVFVGFFIFLFVYFVTTYTYILYDEKPHILYNLVHYNDSSLIINSVLLPFLFYIVFLVFFLVSMFVPARISDYFASRE